MKLKTKKPADPIPDPTAEPPALLSVVTPALPEGVVGKDGHVSGHELAVVQRVITGDSVETAYRKVVDPSANEEQSQLCGFTLFNRREVYTTYRQLMLTRIAAHIAEIATGNASFKVAVGTGKDRRIAEVSAKPMEQIAAAKQVESMLGFGKEIEAAGQARSRSEYFDETEEMLRKALTDPSDITPVDDASAPAPVLETPEFPDLKH